ncbi:GntR family transcriptional regulator [Pseudoalteromonas luteoviolacea]|uniref:GntR family transcriptional regulator n=1 Tax=Pseudoalteromonas luteoviolacea TaxID=43657 RepID=UPI001B362140|nr:GntR family transcriptional regulator [Pseudoalteromonas luteoviolacea]MBQ4876161.1 GntR family transcriptional regulator [Pseudoalteromonas luteoviolacea]MBQ4905796.1 GntR family transcriptional regulator [Pseudoalteromonas luteoviolacea]
MASAELIEQAIEHKQLAYDQRLLAQRVFAALLQITHDAVTSAYDLLELRGYIRAKLGSGTYVLQENKRVPIDTH